MNASVTMQQAGRSTKMAEALLSSFEGRKTICKREAFLGQGDPYANLFKVYPVIF